MIIAAVALDAGAERTTRQRLRAKTETPAVKIVADTVIPDSGMIAVSGFDKPLRSRRETFFVTNRYDRTVTSLTVRFAYYDMSGRQLHETVTAVDCHIPPGETRQLSVKSWDSQQAFYYFQSVKPKRNPATPFSVRHHIENITLLP